MAESKGYQSQKLLETKLRHSGKVLQEDDVEADVVE